MRRRAAPPMDANKGGGMVGTGKATGKKRAKNWNKTHF